jgi:S1-C subfamily serine protease
MVRFVVSEILEDGRVDRGFLGVTIQDVPPAMRKSLGVEGSGGALVSGVSARSPADEAGFEPGDVIVAFDGKPVGEWSRFRHDVAAAGPDRPFAVEVVRRGTKMELRGMLGELPDEARDLPAGMRVVPR